MKRIIALMILLFLILSPSCRNSGKSGQAGKKGKTLEMLKAEQDSIRKADSLKVIERRQAAMEESLQDSLKVVAEEVQMNQPGRKFNIVVGSFINNEFALKRVEEYRKLGYDANILNIEGRDYELVVIGSFDDYSTAQERLGEIKEKFDKNAWIFISR